jgi:transposase
MRVGHGRDPRRVDDRSARRPAERFYDALGEARSHQLRSVSMGMGTACPTVARRRAPQAVICWDSCHVVALASRELDVVRRGQWNHLRATTDAVNRNGFWGGSVS